MYSTGDSSVASVRQKGGTRNIDKLPAIVLEQSGRHEYHTNACSQECRHVRVETQGKKHGLISPCICATEKAVVFSLFKIVNGGKRLENRCD